MDEHPSVGCPTCHGEHWICEAHPDRAWPHEHCAGPGVRCPERNSTSPPALPDDFESVIKVAMSEPWNPTPFADSHG